MAILDYISQDTIDNVTEWANRTTCRCCGKNLGLERFEVVFNPRTFMDDAPIHTRCIPKHWGKHAHGINATRCKEFGE